LELEADVPIERENDAEEFIRILITNAYETKKRRLRLALENNALMEKEEAFNMKMALVVEHKLNKKQKNIDDVSINV
jgi:hypothetical protein